MLLELHRAAHAHRLTVGIVDIRGSWGGYRWRLAVCRIGGGQAVLSMPVREADELVDAVAYAWRVFARWGLG
jgi:hypothetical protein